MKRSYVIKKRFLAIAIIILAIFTSCSSNSVNANSDFNKNIRLKRIEENKIQNGINYGAEKSIHLTSLEIADIPCFDNITYNKFIIFSKKLLILFFIVAVILSFYQFYLYIRNWILLISQTKTKLFLVHYLYLKDGKKNALSLSYI